MKCIHIVASLVPLLLLLLHGQLIESAAAPGIEVPPPEILRFMRRFGYLMPQQPLNGNDNAETLYHESAIVEAIKNVQKYGAINQTGMLDNQTLELFTKARCGVPDIEGTPYYLISSTTSTPAFALKRSKRYVIGARPWGKRHISYFIANWSLKLPRDQVERDIARAFAVWAQYSGLKFKRVNNTAADIIVGFGSRYHGDNYAFDGPGNILAHAFYPYEMGSWGGDLHFDEDENWSVQTVNASLSVGSHVVDFYSVALHELGHSLGLAHSPVYNSIMFPYYKGSNENQLHYDDVLAMHDMYLTKQLEEGEEVPEMSTTIDSGFSEGEEEGESNSKEPSRREDKSDSRINNSEEDNEVERKDNEGERKDVEADRDAVWRSSSPSPTHRPTFKGDFSTVSEHKERYSSPLYTPTPRITTSVVIRPTPVLPRIPDICVGSFDAVATMNGAVYIFKDAFVWRLTAYYTVDEEYPRSIHAQFPFLPPEVQRIDAAYERYDGAMVFFTGATYWVFNSSSMTVLEASPQSLKQYIGEDHQGRQIEKIDAAMLWPKNNRTYLFSGSLFWRYDDLTGALDPDYPRTMQRWPGIPNDIDAAATLTNGKTYFFKDNLYWLYNNEKVRPARGYPRRASTAWLGCPPATRTPLRNQNTTVSIISSLAGAARAAAHRSLKT